jgi:hypothetical protein
MSSKEVTKHAEPSQAARTDRDAGGTLHPSRASGNNGASPSNTAPAKYTKEKQHISPLRCAVDSLYLSFSGFPKTEMEQRLEEAKAAAQNQPNTDPSKATLELKHHCFEVLPRGSGKFAYVLEDNWFRIEISSSSAPRLPLAYVQIKSEVLTFYPLETIINQLTEIVTEIGYLKAPPRISRLDLCLDFYCLAPFDIATTKIAQWQTRAGQIDQYFEHKQLTGWRIGKGNVLCRIYDKTREILKSGKDYLHGLWEQQGWDGQPPVWRVEFQFRREFLNEALILYLDHYYPNHENLWRYATGEWLKLTQINPADTNPSRWPIHPAWLEIADACACETAKPIKRVRKERFPHDKSLFINGLGAISSFMAREGITDLSEAFGEFIAHADKYHREQHGNKMDQYLTDKAEQKARRYNKPLKGIKHE